jgi:hypothetical protein
MTPDPRVRPERLDGFVQNLHFGGGPVVSGPEAISFKNQECSKR